MTAPLLSDVVRRALSRDDLLMTAADADKAVGIVRQREALAMLARDEKSLFSVALEHYLTAAAKVEEGYATRAQAWKHAGVIVRFCEMVGIAVQWPEGVQFTTDELHARSLREVGDTELTGDPRSAFDLVLHTFHRYRHVRDLRLSGDPERIDEAFRLASASGPEGLNGTGAETHLAHLMFEIGALYLIQGQAAQVAGALSETEAYFETGEGAGQPTRYRFHLIRALAAWESGADAQKGLDAALVSAAAAGTDTDARIDLLSATLTLAEYLAGRALDDHARAVALAGEALEIADHVRDRWRVIARSRAPLAVVFQRVYGDIALLAARVADAGGPAAAEAARLGLRVALSAKQTGFAARIRSGRGLLMNSHIEGIIDAIMDAEDGHGGGQSVEDLRFELEQSFSPMLADTVLPAPRDLGDLRQVIGGRWALDYLELTDSIAGTPHLFRTLVRPDGRIDFESIAPDPFHVKLFDRARRYRDLARYVSAAGDRDDPGGRDLPPVRSRQADAGELIDWRVLANILPTGLRAGLAAASREQPIELLVSAHSWLSLIPWSALDLAGEGEPAVRLVERAVVTQTPALTCLQHPRPPAVGGDALIRLVGGPEGVDVATERVAWSLSDESIDDGVLAGPVVSGGTPAPYARKLTEALSEEGRWEFVHIAAHGNGEGLDQFLEIPGNHVSFGRALGLRWPPSVLMASCHVGQVINVTDAEPINMVMALLCGGARCVVAGIASIHDRGTGRAAGRIVGAMRAGGTSLDRALRDAQLAAVDRPEREWALLAAYVQ